MNGRLVTGVEQQDRSADQLIFTEAFAGLLRRDEDGEQIVARGQPTRRHGLTNKGGKVGRRTIGPRLHRIVTPDAIHLHHRVRPVEELGRHLLRHAEQARDHADRDGGGVVLNEIEWRRRKLVDQRVRQLLDRRA